MIPGSGVVGGGALQAQSSIAQVSSWDPNIQAGRPTFVSVPSTFAGQPYSPAPASAYSPAPAPAYATALTPGSSPLAQTNLTASGFSTVTVTRPVHPVRMLPGGVLPPGQPPYYSQ